jgi:hypothetical protein
VSRLLSGAAHLDAEERIHIAGYAEIHGGISPDGQEPARQRKYSGVVAILRRIEWYAMRALREIR